MAAAAERAEPAAGHRACPGTAAGPPSVAVPVPRALFSQKGIFWLPGAALPGQGKCPGKKMFANNTAAVGGRVHAGALRVQHRSVLSIPASCGPAASQTGPSPHPGQAGITA